MVAPLEDRDRLVALFDELGQELAELDAAAEVVMVGGSWLLWHTQRAATDDVDSAKRLDDTVMLAVRRLSARHALDADWLNDRATPY